MAFDVDNNIITIKQLLSNSLQNENYDYIKQVIDKNVKDCNLLYTQVCYLIKLFILYDYEKNNGKYNDYKFNEFVIRKCFRLIKNNESVYENNEDKCSLINRLDNFYLEFNSNENNKYKFVKPNDVSSITHITDALARDIQTNITNNIILNYTKYIREYININLKKKYPNIENNEINNIYNDLINNTLLSNSIHHEWINENKVLLIPIFDKVIHIKNFKEGLEEHKKIFISHINSYIKSNQKLLDLIHLNKDDKNKTLAIIKDKLINEENDDKYIYNEWMNENLNQIVNDFNFSKKIDIEKELEKNPYQFIKYMIYMNRYLELNGSKKKYQIIPLRTNLTPKFIPINVDSLVDILESKYLLNNIKNYYHADNKRGLILFETYFKFDSKYIKKIIEKGYVFSGLINTNGFEINYIFNSKSYENQKNNFHTKGKEEKKIIKEETKELNKEQKIEYEKKRIEEKEKIKNENKKMYQDKIKKNKNEEKENMKKILQTLENKIIELNTEYQNNLKKIEQTHYEKLNIEFDKVDKKDANNKKILDEIMQKLNDEFLNNNIFLKHVYDRNYASLINDYDNLIEEKYKVIKKKELDNESKINDMKNKISKLKNELNELKKEKFTTINKKYEKEIKEINLNLNEYSNNKKIINRLIDKIKKKANLLDYETKDTELTKNHVIMIHDGLIKLLSIIKEMNICKSFNNYLNELGDINKYFNSNSNEIIKQTINLSLKCLSIDMTTMNINLSNDKMKLMSKKFEKIKEKEILKNDEWYLKHNELTKKLNECSIELNKLMNEKNKIEKELWSLFETKNKEIMKVDEMSKKALLILEQMNWVVIDPGMNSILTMMAKDGKTKMTYSKSEYISRTQRKKIQNKIEKIKKEKITKLENKLTMEKTRLRTSNIYKNFNEYFILKMEIHEEVCKLYEDKKLNKLKWYSFINEKRSQSHLINKIKTKFDKPLEKTVLILGDWSMNKKGIKSISTPNKKYQRLLRKHFIILRINEFRTSIIENESELRCENLVKKMDYKNMSIKEIHSLEKIKEEKKDKYEKLMKDKKVHKILTCKTSVKSMKYINRDINSVKNMKKIVISYIEKNKKPIPFIKGIKICNSSMTKE